MTNPTYKHSQNKAASIENNDKIPPNVKIPSKFPKRTIKAKNLRNANVRRLRNSNIRTNGPRKPSKSLK